MCIVLLQWQMHFNGGFSCCFLCHFYLCALTPSATFKCYVFFMHMTDNLGFCIECIQAQLWVPCSKKKRISTSLQIRNVFTALEMFIIENIGKLSYNINPMFKPWRDSNRYDMNFKKQLVWCSSAPSFEKHKSSCFYDSSISQLKTLI